MDNETKRVNSAVVLAAGQGTRFGGTKQDIEFMGKPLWKHVYDAAIKLVDKSHIIVVGKDVQGGNTRSMSVQNGLKALPQDTDRVIILEAARPLVTQQQIRTLLEDTHEASSFVMPLVNTVIGRDGTYYDREKMYNLLTPQAFDYAMLLKAYQSGKYEDLTDDTKVIYDYYGIKPFLIPTVGNLFKVTYPEDIAMLDVLYRLYGGET